MIQGIILLIAVTRLHMKHPHFNVPHNLILDVPAAFRDSIPHLQLLCGALPNFGPDKSKFVVENSSYVKNL